MIIECHSVASEFTRQKNDPMFQPEISLTESVTSFVTPEALGRYGQMASGQITINELASAERLEQLRELTSSSLTGAAKGDSMAECCLSGIWLLYGYLDQSHEISQSIQSQEGSLWHAIMHRLESDFWNSKYWYRKAGSHPVRSEMIKHFGNRYPDQFVDESESVIEGGNQDASEMVAKLAMEEWRLLFQFCFTHANRNE